MCSEMGKIAAFGPEGSRAEHARSLGMETNKNHDLRQVRLNCFTAER